MSVLADLEPRVIMDFFDTLTRIPRGSENEKGVSDWVVQFAKDRGLEYHQDDLWCVLVRKPGSPGYEDAPTLILHGHLDMVCAKDDAVEFDFLTQGLNLLRDGDYITADGTSLGADNGIGVAYILALLDSSDIPHPPLEAVLTSMEEKGKVGGAPRHVAAARHADDRLQLDHRRGDPRGLRRRRLRRDRHPRGVGGPRRPGPGRPHADRPRAHRRPLRVRHPPRAHQRDHPARARAQHHARAGLRPAAPGWARTSASSSMRCSSRGARKSGIGQVQ